MPSARERDTIGPLIENEVGHADKHVLLDIRVKLPVYFLQDVRRGRIPCRLGAQYAAANRHDQRCRNAFTGNVGNCNTKPVFINMNIIEIIATYLARRHIDAADLKSVNGRRFCWKQNSLNVPRNLEVMIESLFFICHRVDDSVVEGKGGLLRNRFENDEIALRKRCTHWAIGDGKDT